MGSRNITKAVFLTGGGGFIGSHLICELLARGERTVSLCLPGERPRLSLLLPGPARIAFTALDDMGKEDAGWDVLFVEGDIRDRRFLRRFFDTASAQGYRFSFVIHLAACSTIQQAVKNEDMAWSTNVEGTRNLLDVVERYRRRRWDGEGGQPEDVFGGFLFASTDKVYGEGSETPYREDDKLNPEYPYERSKAEADRMVREAYGKTGLPAVVLRFCNVYGPGDFHLCRLIPGTLYRLLKLKKPPLIKMYRDESGELRSFRRDLIFVEDIVRALLLLMERLSEYRGEPGRQETRPLYGEAFNLGTNHCYPVEGIVRRIWELAAEEPAEGGAATAAAVTDGSGGCDLCVHCSRFEPQIEAVSSGEIREQCMSYEKAERALGFCPQTTLEEGLRRTVCWYRKGGVWDEPE